VAERRAAFGAQPSCRNKQGTSANDQAVISPDRFYARVAAATATGRQFRVPRPSRKAAFFVEIEDRIDHGVVVVDEAHQDKVAGVRSFLGDQGSNASSRATAQNGDPTSTTGAASFAGLDQGQGFGNSSRRAKTPRHHHIPPHTYEGHLRAKSARAQRDILIWIAALFERKLDVQSTDGDGRLCTLVAASITPGPPPLITAKPASESLRAICSSAHRSPCPGGCARWRKSIPPGVLESRSAARQLRDISPIDATTPRLCDVARSGIVTGAQARDVLLTVQHANLL